MYTMYSMSSHFYISLDKHIMSLGISDALSALGRGHHGALVPLDHAEHHGRVHDEDGELGHARAEPA